MSRDTDSIETHIEMCFSPQELELWGANKIDGRELHIRVLRIFSGMAARNKDLKGLISSMMSAAGLPDSGEACRTVIKIGTLAMDDLG